MLSLLEIVKPDGQTGSSPPPEEARETETAPSEKLLSTRLIENLFCPSIPSDAVTVYVFDTEVPAVAIFSVNWVTGEVS